MTSELQGTESIIDTSKEDTTAIDAYTANLLEQAKLKTERLIKSGLSEESARVLSGLEDLENI